MKDRRRRPDGVRGTGGHRKEERMAIVDAPGRVRVDEPLTDEEVALWEVSADRTDAHREAMAARRGGKSLPPSWPSIREDRSERTDRL